MEINHTSNPSMCKKIRSAIATSPAFRAIYRASSYYHRQQSRPSSNSPPASQAKPGLPQKPRGYSTERAGIIPIKYDYSPAPTPHVPAKFEPEPPYISSKGKLPTKAAALGAQNGDGKNFDSAISEYLESNKQKIRSVSNVGGRGQSIKAAAEENNGAKNMDNHNHKDNHFTDFIERAKKKIRTTSNVGKGSSFKIG